MCVAGVPVAAGGLTISMWVFAYQAPGAGAGVFALAETTGCADTSAFTTSPHSFVFLGADGTTPTTAAVHGSPDTWSNPTGFFSNVQGHWTLMTLSMAASGGGSALYKNSNGVSSDASLGMYTPSAATATLWIGKIIGWSSVGIQACANLLSVSARSDGFSRPAPHD